jgi:Tudor domain
MPVAFECNGKWYRGEVLAWNEDEVFVLFVDYATRKYIQIKNLRILEEYFISQPRMACKGSLHGVKPPNDEVLWDDETIDKFKERVKNRMIYATVRDLVDGNFKLMLFDDFTNKKLFKDIMVKKGLAEPSDCGGSMNAILVSKFNSLKRFVTHKSDLL